MDGRIGVGKVENGKIAVNQELTLLNHHDLDKRKKVKISKLYESTLSGLLPERQAQRMHSRDFRAVHEEQLPPQDEHPGQPPPQ